VGAPLPPSSHLSTVTPPLPSHLPPQTNLPPPRPPSVCLPCCCPHQALHPSPPVPTTPTAEIDAKVPELSQAYFPQMAVGFTDPRVSVHICDGIKFVQDAPEGHYDVIIVDSSDPVGPAEVLFEKVGVCVCRGGRGGRGGGGPAGGGRVLFEQVRAKALGHHKPICSASPLPSLPFYSPPSLHPLPHAEICTHAHGRHHILPQTHSPFPPPPPHPALPSLQPFFEAMHRAVRPGGIICTQAESLWLHLDVIQALAAMCRGVFAGGSVAYAVTTIPTYPSGQIGMMVCSKAAAGQGQGQGTAAAAAAAGGALDVRIPRQPAPGPVAALNIPELRWVGGVGTGLCVCVGGGGGGGRGGGGGGGAPPPPPPSAQWGAMMDVDISGLHLHCAVMAAGVCIPGRAGQLLGNALQIVHGINVGDGLGDVSCAGSGALASGKPPACMLHLQVLHTRGAPRGLCPTQVCSRRLGGQPHTLGVAVPVPQWRDAPMEG
jgi:hypothetical protein